MKNLDAVKNLAMATTGAVIMAFGIEPSARAALLTTPLDPTLTNAKNIDFESYPSSILNGYNSIKIGEVTFSASDNKQVYIWEHPSGNYNTQGNSLSVQSPIAEVPTFTTLKISFDNPVAAFGFNWGAADEYWDLTAFDLDGNVLDSQELPPWSVEAPNNNNNGDFWGIKNVTGLISYVTLVQKSNIASEPDWAVMDNFKYASAPQTNPPKSVPEPTSVLGLLSVGAFGASSLLKRKQYKKN
ncbi:MAG TPA: PEP-CTERM sorting domain-containing protein [Coleofasciculaceae cyanobacterium]